VSHPLRLSLAVGPYAITLPLVRGDAAAEGLEFTPLVLPSPERHWRMLRYQEFDVCELSIAGYLQVFGQHPERWTAIPVFPHRRFRHGYVFVRDPELIDAPERLHGARIGLRVWGNSASLWMRGILQDEHGVDLRSVDWVTEDEENVVGGVPEGLRIRRVGDRGLVEALLEGALDALIYPEVPRVPPHLAGERIHRLFSAPKAAEVAYARRTGVFPIMHLVAMRRELVEEHPWVPISVMTAFEGAKQYAYAQVRNPRWAPLAWVEAALSEQDEILGGDPWAYGYEANAAALDLALRYGREQGLDAGVDDPSELFWPSSLRSPPVYRAAKR
jgi:4,5-dihydroxyphthalate decarboxylase